MAKATIVFVEDERDIQELVEFNLRKEGYTVICLSSGEECLRRIQQDRPDLLLLDLMLPGADGFEICRRLKSTPNTQHIPIVMLTAKGEETDIVTGLELGAEDYITKPFSPKVLLARVRNVLRRSRREEAEPGGLIQLHGLRVDPDRHEVLREDLPLDLTATEFKMLYYLMCNAGRVLTRSRIVDEVHGDDYPVTDRSVDVQIAGLRKKLGVRADLIETVRGVGYRFKE